MARTSIKKGTKKELKDTTHDTTLQEAKAKIILWVDEIRDAGFDSMFEQMIINTIKEPIKTPKQLQRTLENILFLVECRLSLVKDKEEFDILYTKMLEFLRISVKEMQERL